MHRPSNIDALKLPSALQEDFATVQAIWQTGAKTRLLDAVLLCWAKYEKQLRKLFSFLVSSRSALLVGKDIEKAIVQNKKLYPESFMRGIETLSGLKLDELIGESYSDQRRKLDRVAQRRNKWMHGQVTGDSLSPEDLERDARVIIDWVTALASGATKKFGYNGLSRNSAAHRLSNHDQHTKLTFTDLDDFKKWLTTIEGR